MKRLMMVVILLVLFLTVAAPALAQELPPTASEAVQQAHLLLATLAMAAGGYFGSILVDTLKQHLAWLSEKNRAAAGAWLAGTVTAALSGLLAVALDYGMTYAVELDTSGLWAAISTFVAVFGAPVVAELRYRLLKLGETR